jgi:hypothetical protein
MANKDIIIGRVINITGMIGVLAGTVLFTFEIVLILFRRGFGLDIPNSIHWFWLDGSRFRESANSTARSLRDSLEASRKAGRSRWNRF